MNSNNNIPWSEKYRPDNFESIILNQYNRQILNNIVEYNVIPNLLLHGPPGTGKTTTIINLINTYQKKYNQINKSLIIHLNASDDRGIDIIRNTIYNFVTSKNMFVNGVKFVILDEVDYMTKAAQSALKYLINYNIPNVKYCLICNYISKIDQALLNEFCKIKFNNLPYEDIFKYINNINIKENLKLNENYISSIIKYYDYDIRSMINHLQLNIFTKNIILEDKIYEKIYNITKNSKLKFINFYNYISNIEIKYKISKNTIIKNYLNYILTIKDNLLNSNILTNLEFIIHSLEPYNTDINIKYIYYLLH